MLLFVILSPSDNDVLPGATELVLSVVSPTERVLRGWRRANREGPGQYVSNFL